MMERALQYTIGGLATGSLYALVALGIVLLYRTSRVLNFAHGDLATVAAFTAFSLITAHRVPFALAAPIGLAATAAAGAAFYLLVLRPARESSLLGQIVITLGFALLLSGVVVRAWGTDTRVFPFPLSDTRVYRLGAVVISQVSVGALAAGMALMAALYLLVQRTQVGLAMRAVSQDLGAARALGIPARRIFAMTWALAAALGGAAGILLAPITLLDPFMMLDPFLKGFAAAVLGGMDSMPGAVAGGLILGVV
ncbi:MAG: branched-chain amino acid ABC transporter permease, partial [Armatimonadetes bacterium]|nr:branched-chain amino acid ABC transporter permease [Armatimonadota bacterium]